MKPLLNYLIMVAIIAAVLAATGCASKKIYRVYQPGECVTAITGESVCGTEEEE